MKTKFLFLLMTISLAVLAHAELGLALTPMRVEIRIAPGSQYTDSLRLTNDGDDPVRVRGDLLDFFMDETMTPQFAPRLEQEMQFSCRNWLQVNPSELDIPAAENFRVRYTLRVPPDTPEGEYHCGAAFVTMPPIDPNRAPMGMQIAVRAVSAFYIFVGDPVSQPQFKDLSVRSRPDGTWEAFAVFGNDGLRHFRVDGFVEVQDENGLVVDRVEFPSIPVLPKRNQNFTIKLNDSLAPGAYTLWAQADVGLPEILETFTKVVIE